MESITEEKKIQDETCNQETEVYSRVVGFYRPIKQWNKGKKEEFTDRKTYQVKK